MTDTSIPAQTRIGHVHLKVANLERAIGFYRDYLGIDLLFNLGTAAFLSDDGVRKALIEAGHRRVEHFSLVNNQRRLLDALEPRIAAHG